MRITESQLRNIIRSELRTKILREAGEDADSSAGASGLTDQQKKKLQTFAANPPTNLNAFATAMKQLGAILGDIDEKAAKVDSSQMKQYFTQIMAIVDGMMSDKKTSSTETSKVTKAVGG